MNYSLSTQAFYFGKEKIWFAARNFNGLFEMDLNDNVIRFCCSFPGEVLEKKNLIIGVEKFQEELCFLPAASEYIYFYDMDNNLIKEYALPTEMNKYSYKSDTYFIYGENVWLISSSNKRMLKFNMNTKKFDKVISSEHYIENSNLISGKENYIYTLLKKENMILVYDVLSNDIKRIKIEQKYVKDVLLMKVVDNYLFLFERSMCHILEMNNDMKHNRKIEFGIDEEDEITSCDIIDEFIWVKTNKCVFRMDNNSFEISKIHFELPDYSSASRLLGGLGLGKVAKHNGNIYVVPGDIVSMLKICNDDLKVNQIPFGIDSIWVMNYLENKMFDETDNMQVEEFLKYISGQDNYD